MSCKAVFNNIQNTEFTEELHTERKDRAFDNYYTFNQACYYSFYCLFLK